MARSTTNIFSVYLVAAILTAAIIIVRELHLGAGNPGKVAEAVSLFFQVVRELQSEAAAIR